MTLYSQNKFAEYCTVSKVAINKAITSGRVIATDKLSKLGKKIGVEIDVNHPVNIEYYREQEAKQKPVKVKAVKKAVTKAKKKAAAKVKAAKPKSSPPPKDMGTVTAPTNGDDGELPDYLKELINSENISLELLLKLTKVEVDKLKSYHQMKAIKIKAEKDRKLLVSRKLVRSVFSKLDEIDMNHFLTLKDKLIPDLSALAGVNDEAVKLKMGERMDEEFWRVLKSIRDEMNKFLVNMGDEEI